MPEDTRIGGAAQRFPTTRWSVVEAARSEDAEDRRRAFEALIAAYWKPVYKYIRARWGKSSEDAEDLTQEFFTRVMEKKFLEPYDPVKSRLRTFLRICVDGLVANESKAARRLKRGGESNHPRPAASRSSSRRSLCAACSRWPSSSFARSVRRRTRRGISGCSSFTTWKITSGSRLTSNWRSSSELP